MPAKHSSFLRTSEGFAETGLFSPKANAKAVDAGACQHPLNGCMFLKKFSALLLYLDISSRLLRTNERCSNDEGLAIAQA